MPVERFFDTNILPYGFDTQADAKRVVALALMKDAWNRPGSASISVQVLLEFHTNFVRKHGSRSEANLLVEDFGCWPVVESTLSLLRLGLNLQDRWQLSLWDAMILAAAQTAGASELLSEDFNHGQLYGSVRVVNPFR